MPVIYRFRTDVDIGAGAAHISCHGAALCVFHAGTARTSPAGPCCPALSTASERRTEVGRVVRSGPPENRSEGPLTWAGEVGYVTGNAGTGRHGPHDFHP